MPLPSHRHPAYEVRSTFLQPEGPVSPGATWEHGHLQQQLLAWWVVGGGRYQPAMWAPGQRDYLPTLVPGWTDQLSLCFAELYCTVLQSRTQVRTA